MKKELREKVWNKYGCRCAYCGEELEYKKMQVDHIVPKINYISYWKSNKFKFPSFLSHLGEEDLNHIDNLHPACRQCNFYKSDCSLELFRSKMKDIHERIMKPFISRLGAKYGIITINEWDGKFYFEKE